MRAPLQIVTPNSHEFLTEPMIAATGFREYDARWRYPEDINLPGITALGLGLGTQLYQRGIEPVIAVGHDFREYSVSIKNALILGLVQAGVQVKDIGLSLSPMAYFSQFFLDVPAVAMVTASHNPNGWTGVKMGFEYPLTHGPEEMNELRHIVLNGNGEIRSGGGYELVEGMYEAYIDDLVGDFRLSRPLKIVCATGNGTASVFAPEILKRIGAEVIPLHNTLDYTFPHYNPNPEAMEMLNDMANSVVISGADLALGFDGDGDRCGIVDETGKEIFSDYVGVILAREYSKTNPGATFIADVKSTGLFATDPVLLENGAKVDYWKTGHSHMKRRIRDLNALAGFEKSGHYFLAPPIGRGYDCGLRVAVEICKLLDRYPDKSMSDFYNALPKTYSTPTMAPFCPDTEKYGVLNRIVEALEKHRDAGGQIAGRKITDILRVNGARVILDNGAWGLVRASSNTPNLVVVCESPESEKEMRAVFKDIDKFVHAEPLVGDYDQTI